MEKREPQPGERYLLHRTVQTGHVSRFAVPEDPAELHDAGFVPSIIHWVRQQLMLAKVGDVIPMHSLVLVLTGPASFRVETCRGLKISDNSLASSPACIALETEICQDAVRVTRDELEQAADFEQCVALALYWRMLVQ